jgi:hypothetical protein
VLEWRHEVGLVEDDQGIRAQKPPMVQARATSQIAMTAVFPSPVGISKAEGISPLWKRA